MIAEDHARDDGRDRGSRLCLDLNRRHVLLSITPDIASYHSRSAGSEVVPRGDLIGQNPVDIVYQRFAIRLKGFASQCPPSCYPSELVDNAKFLLRVYWQPGAAMSTILDHGSLLFACLAVLAVSGPR
jgi:hypothetical protein